MENLKNDPLLENSFFNEFNFNPIPCLMDIFQCILEFNFNINEARNYLLTQRDT